MEEPFHLISAYSQQDSHLGARVQHKMTTPAWQPRAMQPTSGPITGPPGHWPAPGTVANQGQGPPPRPSYGTPSSSFPQSPAGSLAPFGNPNQLGAAPGSGLQPPGRPASATAMSQGGPFSLPSSAQPAPSYGPPPGLFPGNRWPSQPAGSVPAPVSAGMRPHSSEGPILGPRPGMPHSTPGISGPLQPGPGAGSVPLLDQRPPYQGFPSGPGLGPPQLVGPPWMQPGQLQQRPPFLPYPGNFPGGFPVQQMRPMGPPSEGMLPAGPAPLGSTGPPFGVVGDPSLSQGGQPGSAWVGNAPSSGPPSVSLAMSVKGEAGPSNGKPADWIASSQGKWDSTASGEKEPVDMGAKSGKVANEVVAESADAWTAHKTQDGTIYYYNSVSGQSTYERPQGFKGEADKVTAQPHACLLATSWQVPPEVSKLRKKQAEDTTAKAGTDAGPNLCPTPEKSPVSFTLNVPAAVAGGREAIGHKALVANSALDLIKKKLQDPGAPMISNVLDPTKVVTGAAGGDVSNGKGAAEGGKDKPSKGDQASSDSSSESDEEDPRPTKEQKVLQFKEMLKEKGVAPFSKWEKELPKIIFDPRFQAIPSHTERRSIFEHYVRTRAEEERKERRAAQKAAVEGFKQLLEEAAKDILHSTDYDSFAKAWDHDLRFEALERKDRESLLNERVGPLRKAEEERVRGEHAAAVAGFRALLVEKGDITATSRWSKVKDNLRSDPRYKVVKREDREVLFNAFVAELRAVDQEAEQAAQAKKEEEEKLREREREMRKRKEREEQEMERVRVKARRKDAMGAYQALLTEKIKDPEATWTEARPKLEKDALGRASNPDLDPAERERLFREHLKQIHEHCVREYRFLLADVITVDAGSKQGEEGKTILTSWSEAKKVLKPDPRYGKMPRRERESWWRRYAEDVQRRMKVGGTSNSKDEKSTSGSVVKPTTASLVDASKHSPGSRRSSRK